MSLDTEYYVLESENNEHYPRLTVDDDSTVETTTFY